MIFILYISLFNSFNNYLPQGIHEIIKKKKLFVRVLALFQNYENFSLKLLLIES